MASRTFTGRPETRKRRFSQQCDYEESPSLNAAPQSTRQTSLRCSQTDWGDIHEIGSSQAPVQTRSLSHDSVSTRSEIQAHWHVSPAAGSVSLSSQHSFAGMGSFTCFPWLSSHEHVRDSGEGAFTHNPSPDMHKDMGIVQPEIPLHAATSFFRTYFTVIHPQYPFLDTKICSDYYTAWRNSLPNNTLVGWPAFFVKMIFALGSLIESKSDNSPYFKHQNLKSTAQAEQSIMTDSTSTPLVRLQAMLLSAMFALHAENTWRIAHISGVIMKFASLHRFHRLNRDAQDPTNLMAIRVWSCAYVLDRAVSSALGTPVSLPDIYITSPLCEAIPEAESPVPWLHDCNCSNSAGEPDLRTFAHICKVRSLQSFFMHIVEKDDLDGTLPLELEMHMLKCLREWEDSEVIAKHSVPNSDGYRSPIWLQHIGHLTCLSICFVNRSNIFSSIADTALRAGCEACTSFRSLQKKKEIAQPWLVILSQFRAAVTLWYIVWARKIPVPRDVSDALLDCSAVLAIFAERWPKAEQYRDCFEFLSTSIPRSQPLGCLSDDVKQTLLHFVLQLEESGIHRVTLRMLREMCA